MMDSLLKWPLDKLFPCLDLYRIFLVHPDATMHFKKFEDGMVHINTLMGVLEEKASSDPAKMLALRCVCNLFKEQSAIFVLRERRQKVVETISSQLSSGNKTVREAAITALLNYSIIFLQKDDEEGKIQILSAFGGIAKESEDQCKKRLQAAVTNLTFKNSEGKDLSKALGLL
mmetsp:Transcript_37553/g.57528  ORF Transcript_37553/g.57528 Transcript_37553/m.57528 type:complete len:173 (+) Transcript_37553:1685-2203(+)